MSTSTLLVLLVYLFTFNLIVLIAVSALVDLYRVKKYLEVRVAEKGKSRMAGEGRGVEAILDFNLTYHR